MTRPGPDLFALRLVSFATAIALLHIGGACSSPSHKADGASEGVPSDAGAAGGPGSGGDIAGFGGTPGTGGVVVPEGSGGIAGGTGVADGGTSTNDATRAEDLPLVLGTLLTRIEVASGPGRYQIDRDQEGNFWIVRGHVDIGSNTLNVMKVAPDGSLLGTFTIPTGGADVAHDSKGNIWITNDPQSFLDSHVTKLSATGVQLGSYLAFTVPPGTYNSFTSILAIDKTDNIFLGNNLSGSLSKMAPDGTISQTRSLPSDMPRCIAIANNGDIWVVGHGRVYLLDSDLNTKVEIDNRTDDYIVVDGCAVDQEGNLWGTAGDGSGRKSRLRKFAPDGTALGTYPIAEHGLVKYIAVDSEDNVYVPYSLDGPMTDGGYGLYSGFLYKYSGAGNLVGMIELGDLGTNQLGEVIVGTAGEIFVAGGVTNEGNELIFRLSF